jgi:transcriptional repressor NrdR
MKCPFCGNNDTQVKDSRPSDDGKSIRRRRECSSCGRRFTTFENFQLQQIIIIKSDDRRELFDRDKISRSIAVALNKRPTKQSAATDIVGDIEQMLVEEARNEVSSKEIGDFVMKELKNLDFVGYIRYASVYKGFETSEDFRKLVTELK